MRSFAFVVLSLTLGLSSAIVGGLPGTMPRKSIAEGIGANFSVEGDLQADLIQFGTYVGTTGTDDWFDLSEPGLEGLGVIDTIGGGAYRTLIQAGGAAANRAFTRRMAFPKSTIQHEKLFSEAIYARDYHSVGISSDSTLVTGTREKNINNPRTWNLGTGNTPTKNDIVDVVAHIRRDGDTTNDSLWLFVGMSTMASSGNAYNDYEFFRQADTLLPGDIQLTGTGPDSGHTAWKALGGNLQLGDFIVSVDFELGGTNPTMTIHIWVDPVDTAAIRTASGNVIEFTGIFQGGGELAGPFGYAELLIPAGVAFARVNGIASDPSPRSTLAAPWGSLEGVNATFYDSVQALQFAEAGLNLSALGLDQSVTSDPCQSLFGYLFFKTRSSPSFVADLKDFAGPYPFSDVRGKVVCDAYGDTVCVGETATLTSIAMGGTLPYAYCWQKAPYAGPCLSVGSSLVIEDAQLADAGSYRVIVTDFCAFADTCYADLIVWDAPFCEAYGDTVCEGETATLTSIVFDGTRPYSYCWQKVPYTGPCLSVDSALVIPNASLSDMGMYRVIVDDEHHCGGDTCYAVLEVLSCPADTTSPESIDDLAIALESGSKSASGDIRLWWTEPYDDVGVFLYTIYRSTSAWSTGHSLAVTTDTTYVDIDAVGIVSKNYVYIVRAEDAVGNKSGDSNRVGEFDRNLITSP